MGSRIGARQRADESPHSNPETSSGTPTSAAIGARRQRGAVDHLRGEGPHLPAGSDGSRSAGTAPSLPPRATGERRASGAGGDRLRPRSNPRARAAPRMPTMGEFADKWFEEHVAIKRKPSTAVEYRRIIDSSHIKPTTGSGMSTWKSIHSGLAAQRYVANRVVAVISSIMSHAERHELRPRNSNPCRGLERFREGKRKRPLSRTELCSALGASSKRSKRRRTLTSSPRFGCCS